MLLGTHMSLAVLAFGLFASCLSQPVWAESYVTRIAYVSASPYQTDYFTITGKLEYRSSTANSTWRTIPASQKINMYWSGQASPNPSYVDEAWTDVASGSFSHLWHYKLDPGYYNIQLKFNGDTIGSDTYQSCERTSQLYVPLILTLTIESQTMNIPQDESATTTVTVLAENSDVTRTVSLSTPNWPTNLVGTATFITTQGSTSRGNPFKSTLKIIVSNQTQPGTYSATLRATSTDLAATADATLTLYVQQNVHTITVSIRGLPTSVSTKIYADKIQIGEVRGEQTAHFVISSKAISILALRDPPSNDPLTFYLCEDNVRNVTEASVRVTEFIFQYRTKYAAKFIANVGSDITLTIRLITGQSDTQLTLGAVQGYTTKFYPEGTKLAFVISPEYVPTVRDVNYKFKTWKTDTGEELERKDDGFYEITLNRPYILRAQYDRYASVKIKLEPDDSPLVRLNIGLKGGEKKIVEVAGGMPSQAGEYPIDSVVECILNQSQYIIMNTASDTRYVFQEISPSSQMLLTKHVTLAIKYSVYYKVVVKSEFPESVMQPKGGESWYQKGTVATIQVSQEAWGFEIFAGRKLVRYVFDRWKGMIESNQTRVIFPVMQPMEAVATWKLDITYVAMVLSICVGASTSAVLVFKKRVIPKIRGRLQEKRSARKIIPLTSEEGMSAKDVKAFEYINRKVGEAVKDLNNSRVQIEQSIRRLQDARILGVRQRHNLTPTDMEVFDHVSKRKGILRWSEASIELDINREQIEESIQKLTNAELLIARQA